MAFGRGRVDVKEEHRSSFLINRIIGLVFVIACLAAIVLVIIKNDNFFGLIDLVLFVGFLAFLLFGTASLKNRIVALFGFFLFLMFSSYFADMWVIGFIISELFADPNQYLIYGLFLLVGLFLFLFNRKRREKILDSYDAHAARAKVVGGAVKNTFTK